LHSNMPQEKETVRPPHDPAHMLMLYIYG